MNMYSTGNDILKIYVNSNLVSRKLSYSPLLFPFWGPILKSTTPFLSNVFQKYNFDKSYYTLVDNIRDAEFVFIPHNYWLLKNNEPVLLNEFIREALKYKKLILIDAYGDSADFIDIKNAYILRTSQYRFRFKKNEIIIPAYTEDLLETHFNGKLQIRRKGILPVVGFTGFAGLPWDKYIKSLVKEAPLIALSLFDKKYSVFKKGIFYRKKALKILQTSKLVKSNFIIRNFYSGHTSTIQGDVENLRKEFINNIVNSDYVLSSKGDGNYSYRFYETLSLGRIPLFIDTECVLPLEEIINYRDFCLFVDYRELDHIDKILSEFHKNINDEQFIILQQKARDIFKNYLRIDNFTKYLVGKLKNIAKNYYKK